MKTVGIIGGIAPESTIEYYRFIIAEYRERTGDGSYPHVLINSIDLQRMLGFVASGDLDKLVVYLLENIQALAKAGADFGLLASNTPHIVFDELHQISPIPLLSIVKQTCKYALNLGLTKLGLFGSSFTMQGRFYPDVFQNDGIAIVPPKPEEQSFVHEKYMSELVKGIFLPETRDSLISIASTMKHRDAIDGLILGGTELPLLLRNAQSIGIPLLDTTRIHVSAVVSELLSDSASGC